MDLLFDENSLLNLDDDTQISNVDWATGDQHSNGEISDSLINSLFDNNSRTSEEDLIFSECTSKSDKSPKNTSKNLSKVSSKQDKTKNSTQSENDNDDEYLFVSEDSSTKDVVSLKRKLEENFERTKRTRQQHRPFQSPNCQQPTTNPVIPVSSKQLQKDKLVIYNFGDYLAVRNESNSFFLCRTKQNIYINGRKIKIQWFNNDKNSQVYCPDFYDYIDFECILTNIRVNKLEKGEVSLPQFERQRISNILERAINVEKGINEPPDPTKVLSDGLDISIIGKVEEEEIMRNINYESDDNIESIRRYIDSKTENENVQMDANKKTNGSLKQNELSKCNDNVNKKKHSKKQAKSVKSTSKSTLKTKQPLQRSTRLNNKHSSTESTNQADDIDQTTEIALIKVSQDENKEVLFSKELDDTDLMFDSNIELPFVSSYVNSKLLIRFALLKEYSSLKTLLKENINNLCSITVPRSVFIKRNAIHYAIANEDLMFLRLILNVNINNFSEYPYHVDSMELYHSELMLDKNSYQTSFIKYLSKSYAMFALKIGVSLGFILKILPFFENQLKDFTSNAVIAIKRGNFDLAFFLAREIQKNEKNIFNEAHLKLFGTEVFREVDYNLINNCTNFPCKILPIHIAAINPDPHFFSSLISYSSNQLYATDSDGWMPIHYASVCKTFFNLQYLLNIGVSTLFVDNEGNTPLHMATSCNRIENIALIINNELRNSSTSVSLKSYNKKGWTSLHIACKKGFVNIIKFLIDNKAEVDIPTTNNSGELTSLMIASQFGHLNAVKLLIENGANINLFDKKNRGALTYAVINGHSSIVNCLLHHGVNPACKDIFGNNLFHYALAYGWYYCYQIILKTNASLKDTNTFGLTAICVAFMKGHIGIIEDTLKRNILSVNIPVNDTGITLVMLTFSLYPNDRLISYLKLFVETFKCNLSKADYNGNNTLHYLLQCESKYKMKKLDSINRVIIEALTILLKNGCDPFHSNHDSVSPILFAIKNDCFVSFMHLFKCHYKSNKFQQILSDNEHFWPIIVSHAFDEINIDGSNIFVGKYLKNVYDNQSKSFQNILKALCLKSNKNGEIPIEHFMKISKKFFQNPNFEEKLLNELHYFVHFLINFYEVDFLEDLHLLHLASKYSPSIIVKILTKIFSNIDLIDEFNQTPFAISIVNGNTSNARLLLELGIDMNVKIEDISAFIYELKNNHTSLELVPLFIKAGVSITQTDLDLNTALHLVCQNVNRDCSIESIKAMIEKGLDINLQNKFGQTAVHVAFNSNKISSVLCDIFEILMKNGINLYSKDFKGLTALHYLFRSNIIKKDLIEIVQLINFKSYDINYFIDKNGSNLLHYASKTGASFCLSYLISLVNVNKTNNFNNTPLSLAISNGHKDCVFILLKHNAEILENYQYNSVNNSSTNLFYQIMKNDWTDILFEIIEKSKLRNKLLELVQILIKSQCIEYAYITINYIRKVIKLDQIESKKMLSTYGKFVNQLNISTQRKFLKLFNIEIINDLFLELFLNGLLNWNYGLCNEIIKLYSMSKILNFNRHEKIIQNFISLIFNKFFQRNELPNEMKELILLMRSDVDIDHLSYYPVIENASVMPRYSYFEDFERKTESLIQYSPLIIAVIKKDHAIVQWLLQIEHENKFVVDVNYCDSLDRTPIMHAIFNNDIKMVKLLLNRNYSFQDDTICWNEFETVSFKNINRIDLLARDSNDLTVFHHLISPFNNFNYFKSKLIYSMLWRSLHTKHKTTDFINELYKHAIDCGANNLLCIIDNKVMGATKNNSKLLQQTDSLETCLYSFKSDHANLLNKVFHENKNFSKYKVNLLKNVNGRILVDESSKIPYDVTFTKLDSETINYIYNFYKIQLFSVGKMTLLCIRFGRVGTLGNLKKKFFNSKKDAIEEFEKVFYLKSGNKWQNSNHFVPNPDMYRIADSKKRTKNAGYDLDFKIEKLTTLKTSLPIVLRDLLIRLIECHSNIFNIDKFKNVIQCHLNSNMLANCEEILQKIYKAILKKQNVANIHKKDNLKLIVDIIDLSEEFYSFIEIFGNEFDRLKPFLTLDELYQKYDYTSELKSVVFLKELLFCLQSLKDINPADYIYDSFVYKLSSSLMPDEEDFKFIKLYLNHSANCAVNISYIFKVKHKELTNVNKEDSYLLWYSFKNYEFFSIFMNGIKARPILMNHYPQTIINGIKLCNQIQKIGNNNNANDKFNYLLLCEAKLSDILEVDSLDSLDDFKVKGKNCILIDSNKRDHSSYLFWKGTTVPFRNSSDNCSNEFILLNPIDVTPRFLVEYKHN